MIKYPHTKKNAQGPKRALYPGLTTVSFDRIITCMRYYYVLCHRGHMECEAYVRLDTESADILRDHLDRTAEVSQVKPVPKADIDPDLLRD